MTTATRQISIEALAECLEINDTPNRLDCEHRTGWNVDTSNGLEFVDSDCVPINAADRDGKEIDRDDSEQLKELFGDYTTGEIYDAEPVTEWQARWTMPGFMDCGELYCGETEIEALRNLLDSADSETIDDWEFEALRRLVEIHNAAESDDVRKSALEAILWNIPTPSASVEFNPHTMLTDDRQGFYMGDINPVDHDGRFHNTSDWLQYGYSDSLNICSAENKLWIERGTVSRSETDIDEIAKVFGIAREDVTIEHEIDHNASHWGIECEPSDRIEFDRLQDSGWFLDSDGDIVHESQIEARIVGMVNSLIPTE